MGLLNMMSGVYGIHPAYQGLVKSIGAILADAFYERIKGKDRSILERYGRVIRPKGTFVDNFSFIFDEQRRARLAAVKRVFLDDKLKPSE